MNVGIEARRPVSRLELRGISKRYGTITALDRVDFELRSGEVRALLGKNGAGKSTLVKIISGTEHPDSGRVTLDGERIPNQVSAVEVKRRGVATVFQELSLVPGLTVAENIAMGSRDNPSNDAGQKKFSLAHRWMYRPKQSRAIASTALEQLGLELPLDSEVRSLAPALQQLTEIAKAIAARPTVLVLDEPTSSLSDHDAQDVIALVRRLASAGTSVIYVSHRMKEIPIVADTLTVIRDGMVIDTLPASAPISQVAELMLGELVQAEGRRRQASFVRQKRGPVLAVSNLKRGHRVRGVSLHIQPGEVVGIAGIRGAGRTELLRAIVGVDRPDSGHIELNGRVVRRPAPGPMFRAGVALVPEDRRRQGVVSSRSIEENLVLSCLDRVSRWGFVSNREVRERATQQTQRLDLKYGSLRDAVLSLSGGNQQKVVIGRCLNAQVRVLLLDEPTRGIDIHAKIQIYEVIAQLASQGIGVLLVSSELEELDGPCDRILIMREGQLHGEISRDEANPSRLLALAMGEE